MSKTGPTKASETTPKRRPALTPEAREGQLVSLAVDLAEKQLMEGTASSQVITHYLKLGTTMARLEQVKMEHEIRMIEAKTEALKSQKHIEELLEDAMRAIRSYNGEDDSDEGAY